MRRVALIVAVAVVAAAGGYLLAMRLAPPPAPVTAPAEVGPSAPGELLGQRRPDFAHREASGRVRTAAEFDGRPLLLNFWATWCAPCVEEMPMLSELQDQYRDRGFRVVGIALDERDRAASFARDLGLNYPVLLGEADVVVTSRRFGNTTGMLPYSVLVDAQGVVRWLRLGALERVELERIILENLPSA